VIRIVLDTNVFMSGIFWSGPPSKVLDAWQQNKISLVCSPEIIDEYNRVGDILSKKYPGIDVKPLLNMVTVDCEMFSTVVLDSPVSRDHDDDMFIATALAANCQIIVSGDKDLLEVDGYAGIEIMKPAPFVNRFLKK